ncbi:MAG: hypothetical protein ABH954_01250 [Candidatus Omnitrophota bacterium]
MMIRSRKNQSHIEKGLNLVFLAVYLFIVIIFFLSQLVESSNKPFWGDETYGLITNVRGDSYITTLLHGAKQQGSPAPLDYLACKVLDQLKEKVSYFGMSEEVYFRLFANGITAFSALMIMFLFRREIVKTKEDITIKTAQLFLLLCVPIGYLFAQQIYYYAAETRPYASWNSIFLLVLATSLLDAKKNWLFFVMLILLSLSATAAVFQISAIALAYFMVNLVKWEDFKNILIKTIGLFLLPLCIVLYYCFRAGIWDMVRYGASWDDFFKMWVHQSIIIPFMFFVIVLCFKRKENRKYATAPLAFLILFLLGPLIFWITRLRGFFYSERQFIYYGLTKTVFILTAIKCLPSYVKNIRSKTIVLVVIIIFCVVGAAFTLRPKRLKKFEQARVNALKVLNRDWQGALSLHQETEVVAE